MSDENGRFVDDWDNERDPVGGAYDDGVSQGNALEGDALEGGAETYEDEEDLRRRSPGA